MPRPEKMTNNLFSDLGRATRRGIRNCPKCGTVNGTRGKSCKNKSCDVVFKEEGAKKATTDACRLKFNTLEFQAFSVRIRDRGPDYRNFVLLSPHPGSNAPAVTKPEFPRCYVCSGSVCAHIRAAQNCYSDSQTLPIKISVLSSINIPGDCKQVLAMYINQMQNLLIQRCSQTSFVVKCNTTPRQPLGFLHVLFFKLNRDGNVDQKFLCSCRPFKTSQGRRKFEAIPNSNSHPVYQSPNKLCVHFYACICAFASNSDLSLEFEYFVRQTVSQSYPVTLLSEFRLVAIPESSETHGKVEVEQMDSNHISVEIMRENLSLLESIAASDDISLQNVHQRRVLSDQGVVSNDGALEFSDASALEVLDETDPQVSSHLTHISEILSHSNSNQVVCQMYTIQDMQFSGALPSQNTQVEESYATPLQQSRGKSPLTINTNTKHQKKLKDPNRTCRAVNYDGRARGSVITETVSIHEQSHSLIKHQPILPKQYDVAQSLIESAEAERTLNSVAFERWLGGANEMINENMNYQVKQPENLVFYLPQEIFECMKSRISSYKKRHLPPHTTTVCRTNKPPIGTYIKQIWKITHIVHILHIFQSTVVPLKLSQFFIQTANGSYLEWIQPKEHEGAVNNNLIPVLHCTYLKVGKLDSSNKDAVPFIIEWIPNIYPKSKLGELSLNFQVHHTGPLHTEEERKACTAPIQKLIQQSNVFSLR